MADTCSKRLPGNGPVVIWHLQDFRSVLFWLTPAETICDGDGVAHDAVSRMKETKVRESASCSSILSVWCVRKKRYGIRCNNHRFFNLLGRLELFRRLPWQTNGSSIGTVAYTPFLIGISTSPVYTGARLLLCMGPQQQWTVNQKHNPLSYNVVFDLLQQSYLKLHAYLHCH